MLTVTEIFYSLQGESTHMGRPCIFVRLTGCNLRCTWCDTAYAFKGGRRLPIEAIVRAVEGWSCRLVEVTGGEPLLQPASAELMQVLLDRGYEVLLETSGSLDISVVPVGVKRIVDMKAPGSGMEQRNRYENLTLLGPGDELKLVLSDRSDYEWARRLATSRPIAASVPVSFAPVRDQLPPSTLAEWILDDQLAVRFSYQLHALLWPTETRGR